MALVAAAAAVILIIGTSDRLSRTTEQSPTHREVSLAPVPTPVSPIGSVASVEKLEWSGVPSADLYRLTLFDAAGTVVWSSQTEATSSSLPNSVMLTEGDTYFWKVEARIDWNRWVESELTPFTVIPGLQ